VRSWFNRNNNYMQVTPGTAYSSAAGAAAEISANYRLNFVAFADDWIMVSANGGVAGNAVGTGISTYIGFNAAADTYPQAYATIYDINYYKPLGLSYPWKCGAGGMVEGLNYATLYGATASGTATWSSLMSLSAILCAQS
jgi:hypothetical protein